MNIDLFSIGDWVRFDLLDGSKSWEEVRTIDVHNSQLNRIHSDWVAVHRKSRGPFYSGDEVRFMGKTYIVLLADGGLYTLDGHAHTVKERELFLVKPFRALETFTSKSPKSTSDTVTEKKPEMPSALEAAEWLRDYKPGCAIGTQDAAEYIENKLLEMGAVDEDVLVVGLPSWKSITKKVENDETLDPVEHFLYENLPASYEDADQFRKEFRNAIRQFIRMYKDHVKNE